MATRTRKPGPPPTREEIVSELLTDIEEISGRITDALQTAGDQQLALAGAYVAKAAHLIELHQHRLITGG